MRVKFASIKNDFLRGRAMRQALLVFQRGIEVAGRRYQYATSQLRSSFVTQVFIFSLQVRFSV